MTQSCVNAVCRLVSFGNRIRTARLLTWQQQHAFLLTGEEDSLVAIPQGFTSGYSGEGPRGLETALQLLEWCGAEIEEYEVPERVLVSINGSCLRAEDLDNLLKLKPVRPLRWHDYVFDVRRPSHSTFDAVRGSFPLALPLGVIDNRLGDLVLRFRDDPDDALHKAYRRLEDAVRARIRLNGESGSSLMSKAFQGDASRLHWPGIEQTEQKGRGSLFTGAFMAFRNRRAHRESPIEVERAVREFLLLNELFRLEAESVPREVAGEGG